jgi:ribosomal protein S18 acetylase RimI-like enzyme
VDGTAPGGAGSAPLSVERARFREIGRLAETLALAFADYPWARWAVDAERYERRLRAHYELFLEMALSHGEVWRTAAGDAVAVWIPPAEAAWGDDERRRIRKRIRTLAGRRAEAAEAAAAVVALHRPQAPHWYLAALGVRPERQRRGLGSAVLQARLAECDHAALDTSTEQAAKFYVHRGFRVVGEADVPGGGPHLWFMERGGW